jgi:hypothetical protein
MISKTSLQAAPDLEIEHLGSSPQPPASPSVSQRLLIRATDLGTKLTCRLLSGRVVMLRLQHGEWCQSLKLLIFIHVASGVLMFLLHIADLQQVVLQAGSDACKPTIALSICLKHIL